MKLTMITKSIILLSGGLDSVVSLVLAKEKYNVQTALFFNYGQHSLKNEFEAAKNISNFYNIKLKQLNIDWIKDISPSALTTNNNMPEINENELDDENITQKSANAVWIPNRNALFINIAASFAEADGYSHIIIGANNEEAKTFKDNSKDFIKAINLSLTNSTNNNVQVVAPLIEMSKSEIVKSGLQYNIPFELIFSCYSSNKRHCGKCESCLRLKRALVLNNRHDIIKKIFI